MSIYRYDDPNSRRIASYAKIYARYRQCRKRKRRTVNALLFEQQLEENIMQLSHKLLSGAYRPRPALAFMLHKPKQREIFAADFYDRVVHHILVAELEPLWERRFIYDSYACRVGKGNLAAVQQLQRFTRQATGNNTQRAYYLQLDIKGYFNSIDRNILFERLCNAGMQPMLHDLAQKIIYQDITADCRIKNAPRADFMAMPARKTLFKAPSHKGLPIGNLTSQFFGNVYLDALDQFVKHRLKVRWYVRYCDDFVLLSRSKQQLESWRKEIERFLADRLDVQLRDDYRLARVSNGIDFLGYIVRPTHLLVRRRVVASLDDTLHRADKQLRAGGYATEPDGSKRLPFDNAMLTKLQSSLSAYQGHLKHAASYRLWIVKRKKYPWLEDYFTFDKDGAISLCYPEWKPATTLQRQIDMARYRFSGAIVLVQVGAWWRVYYPQSTSRHQCNQLVHHAYVKAYGETLQNKGYTVVTIAQTGRRVTTIYDRQLAWLLIPSRAGSTHRDGAELKQLRLL